MKQVDWKKFPRIIIATFAAFLLICILYVLALDLLRLETSAAAQSNPARSADLAHVFVSPIAATPVTPPTNTPTRTGTPPMAIFTPATNTPAPAPALSTPVTASPPASIYTPVPPTPAESIYTPVPPTETPPGTQPAVIMTPVTTTPLVLVPTDRNLPWETNCARVNLMTCNPPKLSVGDLRSDWQAPIRAAARTWTNVYTPFFFTERAFTNSERTLVPSFFGAIPFEAIRLAPGEVRLLQLSRIYGTEPSLHQAFDTVFRQRGVIATALGYQDPRNPGKRLAALVILNDYYPLGYSWTVLPGNLRLDVQSIALHELGHVAGLEHTTLNSDVMFGDADDASLILSKRALTSNDAANLRRLYSIPGPGSVTATPDLSSYPPGVYVLSIQPQPENPKRKQRIPFLLTFRNTTGSAQRYNLIVQVVQADGHTFGETNAQNILVPPGTSQVTTPDNWGVYGPGGCIALSARPFSRNEDTSRTQFTTPGGSKAFLDFSVCP